MENEPEQSQQMTTQCLKAVETKPTNIWTHFPEELKLEEQMEAQGCAQDLGKRITGYVFPIGTNGL